MFTRGARVRARISIARHTLCILAAAASVACHDDDGGAAAAASQSAVTISGVPAQQAQVGQAYTFTPQATDTGDAALSFSIQNKPTWASFSIASGQLTGVPATADLGTDPGIIISASNGATTTSLAPFNISVTPAAASATASEGSVLLSWDPPTTDTNGTSISDLAGYWINFGSSADAMTQTVSVADPAEATYTVQNLATGTWFFSVTAYTSSGVQSAPTAPVSVTMD
jgi:hypothetical protein